MPSIREPLIAGEIYHVYNRGVEKRDVFCERLDYIRFIHNLFEFNDTNPAIDFIRRHENVGGSTPHISKKRDGKNQDSEEREKLVDILSFCLMKNHYHLLLRPRSDTAGPLFMKKLGAGYTNAFNEKNHRVGHLFQGRYKAKHVENEEYLKTLICYIHLNPLKFLKKFKAGRKMDFVATWQALNAYRWSSHLDYLGQNNFGSIIEKKFILNLFNGPVGYKQYLQDYMRYEAERTSEISSVIIDFD
jgi:putative transposase